VTQVSKLKVVFLKINLAAWWKRAGRCHAVFMHFCSWERQHFYFCFYKATSRFHSF